MTQTETDVVKGIREEYKYGFSNPDEAKDYFFKSGRGLNHEIVEAISAHKKEPEWMRKFRHKSLDYFLARPLPMWGGDLTQIDFENIFYYIRPTEKQENLTEQGVIFLDMDSGLREHEELVKQYFGTIIPQNDNKFAALNSAVWSGGSFIYVPPGVKVEVKKNARCRYTTIQNWSNNVYNLVTKRAVAYEDATMEWVDGNLGSKLTMKYPAIWLLGERAHGEVLSIAFAGSGQHQDAGGKAVHVAPKTTSVITSKSISKNGGRAGYRGLLEVAKGAVGSKSKVVCDALILDDQSRSDTYPYMKIDADDVDIGHEATVSKIGEEQLFYLMSRGLSEAEASALIVSGFVEPITKELPLEYAVEMNRLIQLQMEGSVG